MKTCIVKRRGFTLIEMLAVIAIIAILAALMLPVLSSARNRAHMAVDQNNIRQILIAAIVYAGNNEDLMARPGWGVASDCWAAGANPHLAPAGGVSDLGSFLGIYNQQVTNDFPRGLLFGSLKNPRVLLCPSDRFDSRYWKRQEYLTSYDWNGAVVGYGAVPDCFRNTRFKPDAILLWEGDEFNIPFGGGQWNDFGNYPDEGISARHGKGAIVGLFGGSAERIKVADWYSTGLAGCGSSQNGFVKDPNFKPDQLPNRVWCNPGATNGMVNMD